MEISITAIHCEISDAVKDYVREKVGKLDKFFRKERRTEVNLHTEEGNHHVELICNADKGHVFTVHVRSENSVHEAIDLAQEKMAKQLRRHKGRVRSHKGKSNRMKLVESMQDIARRMDESKDSDDKSFEEVLDEAEDLLDASREDKE